MPETTAWQWNSVEPRDGVELLIIGDIQVQGRADPKTAFGNVMDTFNKADLIYANLEGMLVTSKGAAGTDVPDKKWVHPGTSGIAALKAANIKVVGQANNVAWDKANILETARVLDEAGIAHTGSGRNLEEAHKPAILERKGVRIGFLQYTARWYRADIQLATETTPGVARLMSRDGVTIDPRDLQRVVQDVQKLRFQMDILVASHHNRDGATPVQWEETESTPWMQRPPEAPRPANAPRPDRHISEEYQKLFAHTALDAGADLVFGHGTHTVQGVEIYKGKPILYAIGHSAFDQPGYEKSTDGLIVRVSIRNKKIEQVSFVPVTRIDNDLVMLDPSSPEGQDLVNVVEKFSGSLPLTTEGHEVVMLKKAVAAALR